MIVAAYARFSSDQQRDTSIHDQFRNCARYASDHGWSITYFHEDKAVSGAHSDRTGYQTMLRDAQAKQFEILLVDDLSRLSRDEAECIQLRRRLHFWGIRLIGVSDGYDSTAKGHKLQASLRGLMNELYLDDLRDKTHRGLMGQALKGYSCGGRAYGYTRVPLYDDTKHDAYGRPQISAVRWIPDPEQAQWVRWIFERYAAGTSPRELAADLNRQQVPSPRGGTWSASAIRGNVSDGTGILCNSLYVGRYVWNRSRWERHFETKRRVRRLRDRQEWIEVSTPELAIVSQALWDQVQARIQTQANPAKVAVPGGKGTVRVTPVEMSSATLAARGFIQEIRPQQRGPIEYDGSRTEMVAVTPWKGMLTKLGDVTDLLQARDDHFVVSGPGDEVTVAFDATKLPTLPGGWVRSYVLRTWGYSKDTSPTTVTGGQVEPLPFNAMKNYPPTAEELKAIEPRQADYRRKWNTRPGAGGPG